MWTSLQPSDVASCPVGELATSAPPGRWHDALRRLGTHERDGAWVVAGTRDVAAALASEDLSVAPAAGQHGPAARLVARMARFSDGAEHHRRRELLIGMLPPVARVVTAAGALANDYLRRRSASFDIMPAARLIPAEALGLALGLTPAAAQRAAALTGALCDAVTPSLRPRAGTARAGTARAGAKSASDAAAVDLAALLASGLGTDDEDMVIAAISILFQARDATAALIGTTLLAGGRGGPVAGGSTSVPHRVEDVLRHEAPTQCTRRTAVAGTAIGDAAVPAGAPVWIFLATAERGTGVPATFGSGPHGCPGSAHAAAIASQVVTVVEADGWRLVPGQRIELEPRPNLRVPARVLVARR
jgi:cytochrome P450